VTIALAIAAIGGYLASHLWLVDLPIYPTLTLAITSTAMLVAGYGVPSLMLAAERRSRVARMAAFFAGVLTAALIAGFWRNTGGIPIWAFGAGVACFLVFKLRFFEDALSSD